jgi:phage repressor protein C with HTH and peptisase S24 domain
MTKSERFGKAINYLRMQGVIAKNEDVATRMGADPSNVSRSIKGTGNYPSDSFLRRFNQSFDNIFSYQWLCLGEGQMLNDEAQTELLSQRLGRTASVGLSDEVYSIPLLPVYAQGGSLNDFIVSVKESDCEWIISPIKGVDYAITVSGESMSPEYPSGSQVLIKKINERAFIDWGRVYVLDTCNGTVIKQLFPSEKPDKVLCKSINPEYPSFEVSMGDVYGVYRVLMCMSMK